MWFLLLCSVQIQLEGPQTLVLNMPTLLEHRVNTIQAREQKISRANINQNMHDKFI